MRVPVLVVVLAVALFAAVVVNGVLDSAIDGAQQSAAASGGCDATLGPFTGSGDGNAQAANLTAEQKQTVALIVSVGKKRNLPPLAWQVAIQAGMTESGLRNLTYGDRDSLGIFQMRPSQNWGNASQVTNADYEVNKFFDVLLSVPNWQHQRPGDSAQDVERSAFPDRYSHWEALGAALVKNVGNVSDPTGCGASAGNLLPPPTAAAGVAERFALAQQGKPYLWGASTNDQNAFDCSSLMLQSYRSAGITLPRVSAQQFHAGALLPVRQAQPGDLLFWAYDPNDPASIHHVAMYLGNNQIVEAPENNVPVRVRTISWTEHELVPEAVRPGV
ncbi:MAG: C40 family peptidase [Sciscionella sp.]|nr:C40 family peptidase [Sciscionella sp.]